MGVKAGLKDRPHRPKEPVITEAAKAWVINIACTKPLDHGLAAELWTISAPARYTRTHAPEAGQGCLARAGKATVWRILKAHAIKPHKVRYYLERRDEHFEEKMKEGLLVYQKVAIHHTQSANAEPPPVITVSLDEKPGVQALQSTAPDLPPAPQTHDTWGRDHEYKRHGTLSILAAVDLHTGHLIAQVYPRHRSREHILLLKELDAFYPAHCTIRVVLDNHSSHISKETLPGQPPEPLCLRAYAQTKHGSWLI